MSRRSTIYPSKGFTTTRNTRSLHDGMTSWFVSVLPENLQSAAGAGNLWPIKCSLSFSALTSSTIRVTCHRERIYLCSHLTKLAPHENQCRQSAHDRQRHKRPPSPPQLLPCAIDQT